MSNLLFLQLFLLVVVVIGVRLGCRCDHIPLPKLFNAPDMVDATPWNIFPNNFRLSARLGSGCGCRPRKVWVANESDSIPEARARAEMARKL